MLILSQNGNKLINYDNVASIFTYKRDIYGRNSEYEIRVIYPAVSSDVLYDTIATFYTEEACSKVFSSLMWDIATNKQSVIILSVFNKFGEKRHEIPLVR